jgi:hypothetical protein
MRTFPPCTTDDETNEVFAMETSVEPLIVISPPPAKDKSGIDLAVLRATVVDSRMMPAGPLAVYRAPLPALFSETLHALK